MAVYDISYLNLSGLATGLGTFTYVLLESQENELANLQYVDSCIIVQEQLSAKLQEMYNTGRVIGDVYKNAFPNASAWPYVTYKGFEVLEDINPIARAISFNPIITSDIRDDWESFVSLNSTFDLLEAENLEVQLKNGSDNTWPINDGIFQRDNNGNSIYSLDASIYVPVWQITPLKENFRAVNFNLFSEPNRNVALTNVINDGFPTLTAFVWLVQDSSIGVDRPSSILFSPIKMNSGLRLIKGTTSVVFSWDDLLRNVLPSFVTGLDVVIRTEDNDVDPNNDWVYTLELSNGDVYVVGRGDYHDRRYESKKFSVVPSVGTFNHGSPKSIKYIIEMYPSKDLYDSYRTHAPIEALAIVVSMVIATSLIFLLYDYLFSKRVQVRHNLRTNNNCVLTSNSLISKRVIWSFN